MMRFAWSSQRLTCDTQRRLLELLLDGVDEADADKARALETAIAVSYWRPWSQSNTLGSLKKKWLPQDAVGLQIHARLEDLRNQTYAHTHRGGGRKASAHFVIRDDGQLESLGVGEEWDPLPREVLPAIIELCETQADRFIGEAFQLALAEL
jgi:hypothetical protein